MVEAADDLVLLIDDDVSVCRTHQRLLQRAGFAVETSLSAAHALDLIQRGLLASVIVTDLNMPAMSGIDFLRAVRRLDPDVPVVILTGFPSLESAIHVIEYGGLRYLTKPVAASELAATVRDGAALHRLTRLKRRALELSDDKRWLFADRAALEGAFERALDKLWIAFQPIVNFRTRATVGYEALMRSDEPFLGTPDLLLDAAERLGRVTVLGRGVRSQVARAVGAAPAQTKVFMNLHAADLEDDELYRGATQLGAWADRIVLEVSDRSSFERAGNLKDRIGSLRALGFSIAVDDLGAGYAGHACFSRLEPDIAKVDISLIRDIDASPSKQGIVESMIAVCRGELGMEVMAEGVETIAERDKLSELGIETVQGYLFGRPDSGFAVPDWVG